MRSRAGRQGVLTWLGRRKALASAAAIAVLAGVPVTVAALHKGFPVSDVSLHGLNVWVTNGADLLAGRLNHQIDQLDASVAGQSKDLDVLQDGGSYFLVDSAEGSLQRVDPAFVSTTDQAAIPKDSWVGYGGESVAILSPDGKLWVLDASQRLAFDASSTPPAAKLGKGAIAVVGKTGAVFGLSTKNGALVDIAAPGKKATTVKGIGVTGDPQLTAVGDTPVVLDKAGSRLRSVHGGDVTDLKLPEAGLKLQQPSTSASDVLVSTASALVHVPLDGSDSTDTPAGGTTPQLTNAADVSAPVQLAGCDYAAWASSARYVYACDGAQPVSVDIGRSVTGADLRFRVNHGVIALNDVQNGDAWVASDHLKLVQNWQQLKPAEQDQKKSNTGKSVTIVQSYQDSIAKRGPKNTPPKAKPDEFGVRPGRATLLPVLDNDEDSDGDVLTVKTFQSIPAGLGELDVVDGGRALQFDPAPSAAGGTSFQYTVTDGRGGEASAKVTLEIHPPNVNDAPVSHRVSSTTVEQNQSTTYNVVQDWADPDGDSIYLQSISKTTDDTVSFTPDGEITFVNRSGQLGKKIVNFVISDGQKSAQGKLEVDVKAAGSLAQVAVPDFAQIELGRSATIKPLVNDLSPSGERLTLVSAQSTDPSIAVTADQTNGTLTVVGRAIGAYYFEYVLGSGKRPTVKGLVRVDVTEPAGQDAPPLAVNDTVYVHPGQTATVNPLDNDVSPEGRVLAVQQVVPGADAGALNIQLLDNTVVKVTSPGVLQHQVQLTYMLSDGAHTVPGTITVVPVAPLVNYQPPVAVNDFVNIRAGDIATIPVLDNDYSPDDQPFTLDPVLASTAKAGGATAFVSGSNVRVQAPSKPGVYSVEYQISDEHSQHAQASVSFTVLPAGGDQAPEPTTLTARAFAGSAIPITIPLDGIDPDGDSVFFEDVTTRPELGLVTAKTATGFVYQAAASSAGTEELNYTVVDTQGKSATGTIRIGVIPRPTSLQPPTAVNDKVEVKPGKTAAVQVLGNDSDPNGYPLQLLPKLDQVDKGITDARTDGSAVIFTAPTQEGGYLLHYNVTNGHGGNTGAYVQIVVSKNAKPRYPTAVDHYVDQSAVKSKDTAVVDALEGAANPSGPVADLSVSVASADAKLATVKGADVTVQTRATRTVVAYQVTDPATKLTGKAFIIVPPSLAKQHLEPLGPTASAKPAALKTTQPPHLKPGLPEQIVEMNGSKTFSLSQLVDVPSKRPASITKGVAAQHGKVSASANGFTFTPAKDYRGPASVQFGVDDGKEQGATTDRVTTLTLTITVGNKDQSDVPPTFTPPHQQLQPGEDATDVDLRAASYQPNPQIKAQLKYEDLDATTVNGVTAKLSGSTLSLSAAVDTQPGTTATFHFKVVPPSGDAIDGEVDATVVSSQRPIAQQTAPQSLDTQRGKTVTLDDAVGTDYWSNPFPDTPLRISEASLANAPTGVTLTNTDDSLTVAVDSGADVGTVTVNYKVEDATKDKLRTDQTVGEFQVVIHDRPDQPSAPSSVSGGDKQASMEFTAPTDNGLPIDQYQIVSGGTVMGTTTEPGDITIKGLTNGKSYTFQVQAHNADGWSDLSPASAAVTPYGTPTTPGAPSISADNGGYTPSTIHMSWSAVADTGGGSVYYKWTLSDGTTGTTSGLSAAVGKGVGTYSFSVLAISNATQRESGAVRSGSVSISDPPPPPPSLTLSKGARTGYINPGCTTGNCYYYNVQADNFQPGSYSLTMSCEGGTYVRTVTVSVPGNGSLSWTSQNDPNHTYCGFPNTHVTMSGPSGTISSATMDFRA